MSHERSEEFAHRMVREYASISQIRAEGVTVAEAADDRVRSLIRLFSSAIDRLTGQWFVPEDVTVLRDGDRSSMVHHPSLTPILEAIEVAHVSRAIVDHDIELLEDDDFVLDKRWVELVEGLKWPRGVKNVRLRGVFGWLDPQKKRVETVSTTAVSAASVDVTVNSAQGFQPRDVALLVDPGGVIAARVIVNTVDTGLNKLTFDVPGPMETVAAGASVRTWGPVPAMIERACAMLVVRNRALMTAGQGPAAGLIRREKTDNYEYELFDNAAQQLSDVTGDPLVDAILEEYSTPPMAVWV